MNDSPDRSIRSLARRLGWTSLALAVPPLTQPDTVTRLVGVDDRPSAPAIARAVGLRELAHGVALLAGPPSMVWTRVVGDGLDIALLGRAVPSRGGHRGRRTRVALAGVLGITAIDLYAAVRAGRDRQHGPGRPGPLHLEASTTVNRAPDDVYAFWRDFENLPRFMLHLQSVTVTDGNRSHWRAHAPIRKSVSWDAEMTGDEPSRRISWMSLPGSRVDNSGTVHFAPAPDGKGTEVRVTLHYDVPGGAVGRAVAKLLGEEPEQQVRDDLRRFKQVMETGDIVRTETLPRGTQARRQFLQRPARAVARHGGMR
jgi:uncharacterized membrane protein